MPSYRRMRERLERARRGPTWGPGSSLTKAGRPEDRPCGHRTRRDSEHDSYDPVSPDVPASESRPLDPKALLDGTAHGALSPLGPDLALAPPEVPDLMQIDGLWVVHESLDPAQTPADHFGTEFKLEPYLDGDAPLADSLLFLDLETTGLAAHDQIFMTGALYFEEGGLQLAQEIAGDVADESVLIERVVELVRRRPRVVTFNGRSFDVPALRRRARFHGIPWREPDQVVDLLHPARRRFGRDLPNCRLGTLEERVLGKQRSGRDIPGAEVPLRFLDFADTGDLSHLTPVLYHNRIDLTTMVVLYPQLYPPPVPSGPVEPADPGQDLLSADLLSNRSSRQKQPDASP